MTDPGHPPGGLAPPPPGAVATPRPEPAARPTVVVEGAHVVYRTTRDGRRGIRDLATRAKGRRRFEEVHAVRGVDLTLRRGETVGLVGSNGSGKSTLLAAMTGLLPLRAGSVRAVSRPRLLGVGAALRPAVSGRRNIRIGGLALGLDRRAIDERIEAVVDFVDIGDAIDRPMSTYSSGQKARLGFAIATLSTPDVLLIDEALVVGDAAFRERCAERLDEITAAAGTVVLVTHNLGEIERADRAVWLDEGQVRAEGDPGAVVDAYRTATTRRSSG